MSRRPRFRETGKDSFFGNLVYGRVVEKDHFLVALKALFDWESLGGELIRLYQGRVSMGGHLGTRHWCSRCCLYRIYDSPERTPNRQDG